MKEVSLTDFKNILGEKIQLRRKDLGLTQAELASRLGGHDKQTISRYETQGANPTAFNLMKIVDGLEFNTVEELLNYESPNNKT